jgi:hypothetical protein
MTLYLYYGRIVKSDQLTLTVAPPIKPPQDDDKKRGVAKVGGGGQGRSQVMQMLI